jgi:hypothetical protein
MGATPRRLTALRKDLPFRTWSWMNTYKENGMFKKRLIVGSVILALLVLLALTGCSSPAGSDGAPGPRGSEQVGGNITPEQLAELFTIHDQIGVVTNTGGTTFIAGIVPAGKTLTITGPVYVTATKSLTVNGTVRIFPQGALIAEGSTYGTIDRGSAGLLIVDGTLVADDTFFDNGIPRYVRIDPASPTAVIGFLDPTATAPARINALFEAGIPAVITMYSQILDSPNLGTLSAWTGTKKIITAVNITHAAGTVDVSDKGQLVIGSLLNLPISSLTLGDSVGSTGATLKASDSGNVTVSPEGSIVLEYGSSSLAGGITINGVLTVPDMSTPAPAAGDPARLPTSVKLSGATITGSASPSVLVLPDADVEIGELALTDDFTVQGSTALTVGTISTSGGPFTLIVPAITVTAAAISIDDGGTDDLTVEAASATATLSADTISGGGDLVFSDNTVKLAGPIALDTGITLSVLDNLGTADGIYTQLAQISGGSVDAAALDLAFISGVYNTAITTTGDAGFSGDTTFKYPLTIGGDVPAPAAAVSITLNGDSIVGSTFSATQPLTIKGSGNLTIGGALTVADVVFDGKNVVLDSGSTNTFGGTLTVGPNASVSTNATSNKFVFGPGTYTPGAGGFTLTNAGSDTINLAAVDSSLTLGEQASGNVVLKAILATQTFTATGTVTLSGKASGAIVVAPSSTLTPSTGVDIALGNGAIVLAGTASNLGANAGYTISGFTAHRGEGAPLTVQATINDQTSFVGTRVGKYYGSGITITSTGAAYAAAFTDHVFTQGTLTTAAASIFASAGVGGGIITKDSDVIE